MRTLLSDVPEMRGTAAELAEALEAEAREHVVKLQPVAVPAAEVSAWVAPAPASVGEAEERSTSQARRYRGWRPWLVLAAAVVFAVLLWPSRQPVHASQVPDAGAAATGEGEPNKQPVSTPAAAEREPLSPVQSRRQIQPDAKGRCPGSVQVASNGACWVEVRSVAINACEESGYEIFEGKCYAPALEVPKKAAPTSSPAKAR